MPFDEDLALRIRAAFQGDEDVAEKRMFGGIAFMLRGNMCGGVTGSDLMVRVGPDGHADAIAQPHARAMDFTGRPMKGFVFVHADGIETPEELDHWIGRARRFVDSLPPK